jgi:hypothetical protein
MRSLVVLIIFTCGIAFPAIANKKSKVLFCIQRNLNRNKIIYEANFDKNGMLNKNNPIKAYWVMVEEDGQKENLNYVEKKMAYGFKSKKINNKRYIIRLNAYKSKKLTLVQKEPFEATIYTYINGVRSKLNRLYINADNSSFWPKVEYIKIEGMQKENSTYIAEKILVKK